jgi:hypothetical protein
MGTRIEAEELGTRLRRYGACFAWMRAGRLVPSPANCHALAAWPLPPLPFFPPAAAHHNHFMFQLPVKTRRDECAAFGSASHLISHRRLRSYVDRAARSTLGVDYVQYVGNL